MQTDDLLDKTTSVDSPHDRAPRDTLHARFDEETDLEKERFKTCFLQAKEYLRLGNLPQAMTICDELLAANPAHPLFIGLKLQVENQPWQQRVDYLKNLRSQIEQISDLGRQVAILQEALARYPNESQLLEVYRNVKGRRDLVNYIVGNARKAEGWEDYGAALDRWLMVKEFHPAYPNLDKEVLRLEAARSKRREATPGSQALKAEPTRISSMAPAPVTPVPIAEPKAPVPSAPLPVTPQTAPQPRDRMERPARPAAMVASTVPAQKPALPKKIGVTVTPVKNEPEPARSLPQAGSSFWNGLDELITRLGVPETPLVRYALISVPIILVLAFMVTASRPGKKIVPASPQSPSEIQVSIRATPAGARLVLDDGTQATTHFLAHLNAGSHTVSVSAPGYISQSSKFLVASGISPVVVNLKPQPLTVRLNAKVDWATVAVDNASPVPLDAGSFELKGLTPGPHRLEFVSRQSKAVANFDFQPGDLIAPNISTTAGTAALITTGSEGKTRVYCTCTPTMVAVDGKMLNLPSEGLELALSPGEHKFELGTLNGKGYSLTTEAAPALTISMFAAGSKTLSASDSTAKPKVSPEASLAEVRGLMADKHYAEADSKLGRVLAAVPDNEAALRMRKDLDTLRRLDPEAWK